MDSEDDDLDNFVANIYCSSVSIMSEQRYVVGTCDVCMQIGELFYFIFCFVFQRQKNEENEDTMLDSEHISSSSELRKGSVICGVCRQRGHNARKCLKLKYAGTGKKPLGRPKKDPITKGLQETRNAACVSGFSPLFDDEEDLPGLMDDTGEVVDRTDRAGSDSEDEIVVPSTAFTCKTIPLVPEPSMGGSSLLSSRQETAAFVARFGLLEFTQQNCCPQVDLMATKTVLDFFQLFWTDAIMA